MEQYQIGSSVHGKVKVAAQEGGGSTLTARDGVKITRTSKVSPNLHYEVADMIDESGGGCTCTRYRGKGGKVPTSSLASAVQEEKSDIGER